jgi:hypothetical protein
VIDATELPTVKRLKMQDLRGFQDRPFQPLTHPSAFDKQQVTALQQRGVSLAFIQDSQPEPVQR